MTSRSVAEPLAGRPSVAYAAATCVSIFGFWLVVALEVREGELRLLEDPVLAALLESRGLVVDRCCEPFLPEAGETETCTPM